jgi:hypothetical protein
MKSKLIGVICSTCKSLEVKINNSIMQRIIPTQRGLIQHDVNMEVKDDDNVELIITTLRDVEHWTITFGVDNYNKMIVKVNNHEHIEETQIGEQFVIRIDEMDRALYVYDD